MSLAPDMSCADETVAALLAREPRAARVLLRHGLHCVGCAIAPFETIAEICAIYGVSLERLLVDLRDHGASETRDKMNSTTTATSTRRVLGVDRRKPPDRPMSRDMARIRNEYVEMPGLELTLPQAARLWSLSESRSQLLLSLLVEAGFLICDKKTVYRRRLDRSEKRESDAPSAVATPDIVKPSEAWDIVDEASYQSFPASDPPSWTFGVDQK